MGAGNDPGSKGWEQQGTGVTLPKGSVFKPAVGFAGRWWRNISWCPYGEGSVPGRIWVIPVHHLRVFHGSVILGPVANGRGHPGTPTCASGAFWVFLGCLTLPWLPEGSAPPSPWCHHGHCRITEQELRAGQGSPAWPPHLSHLPRTPSSDTQQGLPLPLLCWAPQAGGAAGATPTPAGATGATTRSRR